MKRKILFFLVAILVFGSISIASAGKHYGYTSDGVFWVSVELTNVLKSGARPYLKHDFGNYTLRKMQKVGGYYMATIKVNKIGRRLLERHNPPFCMKLGMSGDEYIPHQIIRKLSLATAKWPGIDELELDDIVDNGVRGFNFVMCPDQNPPSEIQNYLKGRK